MITIVRAGIVVVLVWIAGCAPTPAPVTGLKPSVDVAETSVLRDAEKAFDAAQYGAALDAYHAFLRENYKDPLADEALFKIGEIFRLTGQPDQAIAVFSRLTREFVRGDRVPDATLGLQ